MLDSYELVEVATWMMIAGGIAAGIGLMGMFLSNGLDSRGSLSKPMAIIGLGFLMVGVFLDHYYY
jgi:hypothetical protein